MLFFYKHCFENSARSFIQSLFISPIRFYFILLFACLQGVFCCFTPTGTGNQFQIKQKITINKKKSSYQSFMNQTFYCFSFSVKRLFMTDLLGAFWLAVCSFVARNCNFIILRRNSKPILTEKQKAYCSIKLNYYANVH